jgi:8-oxo-dGTP diphosphatase
LWERKKIIDDAAARVLKELTNLDGLYLEQLHTYGECKRDRLERTISVAYFALIDINRYKKQISWEYHAEWFSVHEIPSVIFDHRIMIEGAIRNCSIRRLCNLFYLNCYL